MDELAMEKDCQKFNKGSPTVGASIRRGLFGHVGPLQGQQGFPAVKGPAHRCSVADGREG